jgi:hypothetical protein
MQKTVEVKRLREGAGPPVQRGRIQWRRLPAQNAKRTDSLTVFADKLEQAAEIPMHSSVGLQKGSAFRDIDQSHLRAIPDSCDSEPQQLVCREPSVHAPIVGR